jgi:hypothetical protein
MTGDEEQSSGGTVVVEEKMIPTYNATTVDEYSAAAAATEAPQQDTVMTSPTEPSTAVQVIKPTGSNLDRYHSLFTNIHIIYVLQTVGGASSRRSLARARSDGAMLEGA